MRSENMLECPPKINRMRLMRNALPDLWIRMRRLRQTARSVILKARITGRARRYSGDVMPRHLMRRGSGRSDKYLWVKCLKLKKAERDK